MSSALLENYDIKTTDSSICESVTLKENFIKIIQERWGDTPEGNYTNDQLEAWAEYGSPHAFYEQQYSFAPVFYDDRNVPQPLNDFHQKSQNQVTLQKLGTSLYTRKVLRSQDAEKISVSMRSVNRFKRTLISHYPSLKDLYTQDVMDTLESVVYKLKYNTLAQLMTRLTFRLAHENGIYLDLHDIADILGINREGASIVYNFLNEIGLPEPSLFTINTNLVQRIRDLLCNLVQLDYIHAEEAGKINSQLDKIDITSLTNQKKFRAEINLILMIEDFLQITTHDIMEYFLNGDQLAIRNLSYARKNHKFLFTSKTSENTHDSIYEIMKHEFGLDLSYNLFDNFTNQLMDLGTSQELAAVLIQKTINLSTGVRTTIEAISSNPFELMTEYREFMKSNADHEIFKLIIESVPKIINQTEDENQCVLADQKLPENGMLQTDYHNEIDFNKFSRIIVVQQGHLVKGYSYTFLETAMYFIRHGAWTLNDERGKFLETISNSHPSLYRTFFNILDQPPQGIYDNWVVQFRSAVHPSRKQLLAINVEYEDVTLFSESGTLLIYDYNFEKYNHLFPHVDGKLSLIKIGNNEMWFSYNVQHGTLVFDSYKSNFNKATSLLGHKGEIRRGILSQTNRSVLWLESERDFRKEIRRIFWKSNALDIDIDELISRFNIHFQPQSFTSLSEIKEFLEFNPPIKQDLVIPDIRDLIIRETPLLDPNFDINSYTQDLKDELAIELSNLEFEFQLELDNIKVEYKSKLMAGEITPNLYSQLIEDYRKTQSGLYNLTKQQRMAAIESHIFELKMDRQSKITDLLLDKYNANYEQALADLEFILAANVLHIGCSLSKQAKLKQPEGIFISQNELDKKLIQIFSGHGIIHTDFPVSSGMILERSSKSENIRI